MTKEEILDEVERASGAQGSLDFWVRIYDMRVNSEAERLMATATSHMRYLTAVLAVIGAIGVAIQAYTVLTH
jgi:hypothetical protein